MENLAHWRSQLTAMRADVEAKLKKLDSGERTESSEAAATQRAKAERELDQIVAAFARMSAGTYGECTRCGDPIEVARLEILPFTALCQTCAKA
jgi:RNA polymerase-binding transcription factor